jgi:hypothetical protein
MVFQKLQLHSPPSWIIFSNPTDIFDASTKNKTHKRFWNFLGFGRQLGFPTPKKNYNWIGGISRCHGF